MASKARAREPPQSALYSQIPQRPSNWVGSCSDRKTGALRYTSDDPVLADIAHHQRQESGGADLAGVGDEHDAVAVADSEAAGRRRCA